MDTKIFTIKQLAERHPFLTENSIRWMLYKDEPGLEDCLIRNSRRIYIIEDSFLNFLLEKSKKYKEKMGLLQNVKFLTTKEEINAN